MSGYLNSKKWLVLGGAIFCIGVSIFAAPTRIVIGPDTGLPPEVVTFSPTGAATDVFLAEDQNFKGGIRVAMGNIVTANDIITGAGPGSGPSIKVYRGNDHSVLVRSFFAYPPSFNLGVFVAAADINGDGRADIIVGPDGGAGSSPNVKVFSGADSSLLNSFFAFNPSFTGGVRVAAADLNGDGVADIIAGSGSGGNAQIIAFDGKTLAQLRNFLPFGSFTGGVYVAAGMWMAMELMTLLPALGPVRRASRFLAGRMGASFETSSLFPTPPVASASPRPT